MKSFLKKIIPPSFYNYYRYLRYSKKDSTFLGRSTSDTFTHIFKTNHWEGDESICGETSGIEATVNIRKGLKEIIEAYQIASILDIPCGDFVWMNEVELSGIDYLGGDIVEEMILENRKKFGSANIGFEVMNLIEDRIPKKDLILCRDALVHLSFDNIQKSLQNIKESESKYLFCTSFVNNRFNYDITDGDWRTLNMQIAPFHFPRPLLTINENCQLGNGAFQDKAICLWNIHQLP